MDDVKEALGVGDPSELEKYNQNHDPETGKFARSNTVTPYQTLSNVVNTQGVSEDESNKYQILALETLNYNKVLNMNTIEFTPLDGDTFAQCETNWAIANPTKGFYHILRIDTSKKKAIEETWNNDSGEIWAGRRPWLASSYGTMQDVKRNLIVHELGHAVLGQHTLSKPVSEWIDPNNPQKGDKEWQNTVSKAAKAGWKAPSEYAKQGYGELFCESSVMIAIKGTAGNTDIDNYVKGVTANG